MNESFDERYVRVASLYSEESMKAIAAQLIEAYRRSDLAVLNRYAYRTTGVTIRDTLVRRRLHEVLKMSLLWRRNGEVCFGFVRKRWNHS